MAGKQKYTAAQVAAALKITRGGVYLAAERLGCRPHTVYAYMNRYPSVREAKEAAEGHILDVAEVKLYEQIMAGNIVAIKYVLSTKGKDRGYIPEQNVNVNTDHGIVKVPEPIDAIDAEFWDASVAKELDYVRQIANGSTESDLGSE